MSKPIARKKDNTIDQLTRLTDREKDILLLISKSYTTDMIARHLALSSSTIKNHRHNICKKLSLSGKTHVLLNWALQHQDLIKN